MEAKEVKAFFERVAGDWDTMRLACYATTSVLENPARPC